MDNWTPVHGTVTGRYTTQPKDRKGRCDDCGFPCAVRLCDTCYDYWSKHPIEWGVWADLRDDEEIERESHHDTILWFRQRAKGTILPW